MSFYKTTMKDIASAAKVSRRTLYTHFNSKGMIFDHIVQQKIELVQPNYETTDLSLYTKSPRAKAYTAVLNREIVKEKLNPSFTYIKRENVVYAYIRKLQERMLIITGLSIHIFIEA